MTDSHPASAQPRLVAFYLPQFHPTPENDAWWGKGFTEWTNVTKAQPLFEGHYQPHLPSDLGFYDLRVRQTRRDQIALAKAFGVDAFCYHYYWFSGRRLLHLPLDDMLADQGSDMPFCICWANENWTRRWDAADHQVLMEQKYLPEDRQRFIEDLLPLLQDVRYMRVDGRPFVIVYSPQRMPDCRATLHVWREHCRKVGLGELHLCAALTHGNEDYLSYGFDSGVEFPPHNMRCETVADKVSFFAPFFGYVVQYADVARAFLQRHYAPRARVFRTVFPSWDNTARTGARAVVVLNGTPANYAYWLSQTLEKARTDSAAGDKLVFVNAWNEWAEGCHLEPDRRHGDGFLRATRDARLGTGDLPTDFVDTLFPGAAVAPVRRIGRDLAAVFHYHLGLWLGWLRISVNRRPRMRSLLLWVVQKLRRFGR